MTDWQTRAQHLADELSAAGKLSSPPWQQAVAQVPRHELVPTYYTYIDSGWQAADTSSPRGRQRWLELVYSNKALFVLPDGLSSTSMPGLMTRMLEALDVHDGHRVLEIGTGSGYNAALLCHRLGDEHVFSVDIDAELIGLARTRLAAIGYRPTLVAADGSLGLAEHAPFDRVIATCSVPSIPWAWVRQTRVGGLILADLKLGGHAGNLVLLQRGDDRAEGRFDPTYGSFMSIRQSAPPPPSLPYPDRDRATASASVTHLDLARPWEHLVFWFFVHLDTDLGAACHGQVMDPATGQPGDAFLATPDGSWCEISVHPDGGGREVWQGGPRKLWDQIEAADQRWSHLGQPGWERFGLTVTEQGHTVWLDAADGDHSWPLPRRPVSQDSS